MQNKKNQSGFSLMELIMVVVIVMILSTFTLITLRSTQLLVIDNQGKQIIDVLDEARQKAMNQRQTMRVEINRTRNQIRLIDENDPALANDDIEVKRFGLSADINVGTTPNNITSNPATTSPIPVANYQTSNYQLSPGEEKITLRFRRNGQVSNSETDLSLVSGVTIFLATNKLTNTANNNGNPSSKPLMVRAVTVLGGSGDTSLMKCVINASGDCTTWVK
jgi:prepilin-type N-terminal cleavage/methylation domain-containing protein